MQPSSAAIVPLELLRFIWIRSAKVEGGTAVWGSVFEEQWIATHYGLKVILQSSRVPYSVNASARSCDCRRKCTNRVCLIQVKLITFEIAVCKAKHVASGRSERYIDLAKIYSRFPGENAFLVHGLTLIQSIFSVIIRVIRG